MANRIPCHAPDCDQSAAWIVSPLVEGGTFAFCYEHFFDYVADVAAGIKAVLSAPTSETAVESPAAPQDEIDATSESYGVYVETSGNPAAVYESASDAAMGALALFLEVGESGQPLDVFVLDAASIEVHRLKASDYDAVKTANAIVSEAQDETPLEPATFPAETAPQAQSQPKTEPRPPTADKRRSTGPSSRRTSSR